EALAGRAQQRAEPLGAARVRGVVDGQALRLGEGPGEEDVGRRRQRVAGGPLLLAQGAAEPPQVGRVHAGEGGGEEGGGGGGGGGSRAGVWGGWWGGRGGALAGRRVGGVRWGRGAGAPRPRRLVRAGQSLASWVRLEAGGGAVGCI